MIRALNLTCLTPQVESWTLGLENYAGVMTVLVQNPERRVEKGQQFGHSPKGVISHFFLSASLWPTHMPYSKNLKRKKKCSWKMRITKKFR